MAAARERARAARLQRFAANTDGALVALFALVSTAVFAIAALSIDYLQLVRTRGALQQSLDNATIAAGIDKMQYNRDPAVSLTSYFDTNWKGKYGTDTPVATLDVNDAERVAASAVVNLPTTFASVLGFKIIPVSATSEARFGIGKTEVALAVDNTGSMSGTKLSNLIDSAKLMVDEAYALPSAADKIKFGIVPFGQYVNVGLAYRNASWMEVDSDSTTNVCWQEAPVTSTTNCRTVPYTYYVDGVRYDTTTQQCDYTYGAPVTRCGPQTTTWNGCVGSLAPPKDMSVVADSSQRVPGLMNRWCNSPLLRLTNDQAAVRAKIDEFVATGDTYLPSGLLWGWRLLSPTEPFADGAPTTGPTRARKVLVLMTDGVNTLSANTPYHESNDRSVSDALTANLCTAIKAANIEIFTVAYEVTDNAVKDLLRNCANGPPLFFDAANASELRNAFKTIGASLGGVRLAK